MKDTDPLRGGQGRFVAELLHSARVLKWAWIVLLCWLAWEIMP